MKDKYGNLLRPNEIIAVVQEGEIFQCLVQDIHGACLIVQDMESKRYHKFYSKNDRVMEVIRIS